MPTTVYRIVRQNPPSERDLMTYEELGIPVTSTDPDAPRMRTGISVFMSLSHARQKAKGHPWKGQCLIAEIALRLSQFSSGTNGTALAKALYFVV